MTSFEQTLIQEALRQHAGNIKQTAAALKIPRQTLQYKLKNIQMPKSRHFKQVNVTEKLLCKE